MKERETINKNHAPLYDMMRKEDPLQFEDLDDEKYSNIRLKLEEDRWLIHFVFDTDGISLKRRNYRPYCRASRSTVANFPSRNPNIFHSNPAAVLNSITDESSPRMSRLLPGRACKLECFGLWFTRIFRILLTTALRFSSTFSRLGVRIYCPSFKNPAFKLHSWVFERLPSIVKNLTPFSFKPQHFARIEAGPH